MRSTPCPKLTLRTVKLGCRPPRCLITVPSNICTRSLSPSLIFTCTRTVSPGTNDGRSVRRILLINFSNIGWFDIFGSSILSVSFALDLRDQSLVLCAQLHPSDQVRTIAQRLLQSLPAAPLPYGFVVAVHQRLRHWPAAKLRRTSV